MNQPVKQARLPDLDLWLSPDRFNARELAAGTSDVCLLRMLVTRYRQLLRPEK
jgi:hypothetical protein